MIEYNIECLAGSHIPAVCSCTHMLATRKKPWSYRMLLEVRQVRSAAAVQQDFGRAQLLLDDGWLCTVQEAQACYHMPQHRHNHLVVQHHLFHPETCALS